MFTRPRPRREVSATTLHALGWAFRHSYSRGAYVLRGIGKWVGPVLTTKPEPIALQQRTDLSAGMVGVAERPQVGRVVGPAIDQPAAGVEDVAVAPHRRQR